jgi:hypothetical protein
MVGGSQFSARFGRDPQGVWISGGWSFPASINGQTAPACKTQFFADDEFGFGGRPAGSGRANYAGGGSYRSIIDLPK